jgi:hypothetical protein
MRDGWLQGDKELWKGEGGFGGLGNSAKNAKRHSPGRWLAPIFRFFLP